VYVTVLFSLSLIIKVIGSKHLCLPDNLYCVGGDVTHCSL